MPQDFKVFLPIAKVDKEKQTVSGYASTPTKDGDGEIVTLDAIRGALPDYMAWGNIREMHKLNAVGVAQEANIDTKGLFLTAKIVDKAAWEKCLAGVYKGFSIGGRKVDKVGNEITEIEMTEISIVDRPSNPDCSLSLAKSAKALGDEPAYLLKVKNRASVEGKALAKMARIVEGLAKAGPPAVADGFSLPPIKVESAAQPDGTMSPNDSRPNENVTRKTEGPEPCKEHGKVNCQECADKAKKALDAPGDGTKPYGDVAYADNGLQEDGKKRYPIDTEEHIRAAWNYINKPKNAAKYGEKASGVKAKIVAAWKAKVDKAGPPSAVGKKAAKKLAKARIMARFELGAPAPIESDFLTLRKVGSNTSAENEEAAPVFETLKKGMSAAGSLSYVFDQIRNAQRSLLMEGKREGKDSHDKDMANKLGDIAKQLASVISDKASHEGEEATTLTDADDMYIQDILGEDKMATLNNGAIDTSDTGGDELTKAVAALMQKAAVPTKAMRMASAADNVKKSRKACKAARGAIEEVHKMMKASYIAKMEKAKKVGDGKKPEDDGEFDHAGAMEKLQKAYGEIDKARTFGKAAAVQIAKASGSPTEATSGFAVPPGVKDLSVDDLALAGPAFGERGTRPPPFPGDGTFSGKGVGAGDLAKYSKNGQISTEVATLIMEKAKADGELEALRRLPATGSGGRRPYTFDVTKAVGGGEDKDVLNKALFDGVDTNALASEDERAHTDASARVIGNLLTSGRFSKSILDPVFKGLAGAGH